MCVFERYYFHLTLFIFSLMGNIQNRKFPLACLFMIAIEVRIQS
jgi:hypothetical protein